MLREAVIVEAVRTPFAKVNGALRAWRPVRLLAHALRGLTERCELDPAVVDDIVAGCVTQCGEQGGNIARLAALWAGLPPEVTATTVNRWCGSGQQAVHFAAQAIEAGDARFCIGCGVESMTRVPIYSDLGGLEKLDEELVARLDLVHQGESGERVAERYRITRAEADAFGIESQRRAARAADEGCHAELLEIEGVDGEGAPVALVRDEGIRAGVDEAKVARLPTVFRAAGAGVLTAANSSQFADGAAAVLVADRAAAVSAGLRPRAGFLARVVAGGDPSLALMAVVPATQRALKEAGLTIHTLDWIEVNEAFSTVVLAWLRETGADEQKVNPCGGAIAHGHPVGASGAGLMAKMIAGLTATGGTLGLQVMSIGHGQATATVIERTD